MCNRSIIFRGVYSNSTSKKYYGDKFAHRIVQIYTDLPTAVVNRGARGWIAEAERTKLVEQGTCRYDQSIEDGTSVYALFTPYHKARNNSKPNHDTLHDILSASLYRSIHFFLIASLRRGPTTVVRKSCAVTPSKATPLLQQFGVTMRDPFGSLGFVSVSLA